MKPNEEGQELERWGLTAAEDQGSQQGGVGARAGGFGTGCQMGILEVVQEGELYSLPGPLGEER